MSLVPPTLLVPRGLAVLALLLVWAPGARAESKRACVREAEEAQELRRQHHLHAARALLAQCADPSCPGLVRTDCAGWLSEVDAALPSVLLRARDARGVTPPSLAIRIDGHAAPGPAGGDDPIPLDPGVHALRVEADGFVPVDTEVTLREGDVRLVVAVLLEPLPKAADATAVSAGTEPRSGAASSPSASTEDTSRGAHRSFSPPLDAWVVGGSGAGAIGVGAILWGIGLGERSALYARCGQPGSCSAEDIDAATRTARAKLIAGDVFVGAGAIAVGAAAWLTFASPSRHSDAPSAGVAVVPGGATVVYAGRF
jgi:hypothetical protein